MDFDNSTQVDALAKLPPEPPKPPERSAWGWVPRITKAAVAGVAGSVADVVKGAAAADALTLGADPRARGAFTEEQLQAGQVEGQRQIDTGEAMTSTLGDSFRQVQRDARPDPLTAGTAERLVFGVAEPMLKLIGGGMTLGPFGLGAASAEIGMQQSDDLRQQGVDLPTRTAVGALTAGVTAASVALPMVGQTLKSTAGLYVAGGPGGFMAQQAATSEILKRAGYAKIAEQFDPLDPVGLAMSALIPLPFAAWGARGVVKGRKAGTQGTAGTAGTAGIDAAAPSVVAETPTVPREAVDAAMVHNLTLQRQAQAFEAPRPDVRPAVTLDGNWLSAKVDGGEVAGRILDDGLHIKFAELDMEKRGNGTGVALYQALVDNAHAQGLRVFSDITVETPAVRVYEALARRGYELERLPGGGELPVSPESPEGALFGRGANSPVFEIKPRPVGAQIASASLTDPRPVAPPVPKPAPEPATPYGALTEAVTKAQDEFAAFQKAGGTLDQFLAQRELPPAVNNLLIGLTETMKDPRRAKALLDLVAKNAGDTTKSAADVTADAVEGVRALTDADLTNTPSDTIAAKPDPLMQSVTERVAAVEMTNPDMVVGTTEDGNPITVRDELARIRKEAFEGTDVELGAKDADLVSVAANCALTNGG